MKALFHNILRLICILLAVLLLATTLAGQVAPSRFIGFSLLSYGYPYLLIANVLLFVLLLCYRSRCSLIPLAAILLRCNFIPLFVQIGGHSEWSPAAVPDGPTSALRVLTFNTHAFQGADDSLAPAQGAAAFIDIVRQEQPDVLVLEEFFEPRGCHLIDTLASLGLAHSYGIGGGHSKVVVFSRYPFDYVHTLTQGKLVVDIHTPTTVVRLLAVHLGSYHLPPATPDSHTSPADADSTARSLYHKFRHTILAHEREWEEDIRPIITETAAPLIVAGDFNDPPTSYLYHQMRQHLDDSYLEQGRGLGTTYHGPYPAYRIDYILHTGNITARSYRRIHTAISDHYPILVTFDLRPPTVQ